MSYVLAVWYLIGKSEINVLFTPIGLAPIKGSGYIVLLGYNEDPRINNIVFLFDFGCGVELGDRDNCFSLPCFIGSIIKHTFNIAPLDKRKPTTNL